MLGNAARLGPRIAVRYSTWEASEPAHGIDYVAKGNRLLKALDPRHIFRDLIRVVSGHEHKRDVCASQSPSDLEARTGAAEIEIEDSSGRRVVPDTLKCGFPPRGRA